MTTARSYTFEDLLIIEDETGIVTQVAGLTVGVTCGPDGVAVLVGLGVGEGVRDAVGVGVGVALGVGVGVMQAAPPEQL